MLEEGWPRPKNALSYFVTRALKELPLSKPLIRGVLSFADTTEGHVGAIYRATNWMYFGKTGKIRTFYKDPVTGRLHHPRICGVNITIQAALDRGWIPVKRGKKHKYFKLVGDKRQQKEFSKLLLHEPIPW
jgi:hypothetical protein